MDTEIIGKKIIKKYDFITITNKDDKINIRTKTINLRKLLYVLLIILLVHILFYIYLIIFDKRLEQNQFLNIQNNNNLLRIKNDLLKKTSMIQNLLNIIDNFMKNKESNLKMNSLFNEIIKQKFYFHQYYFCQNQNLFNNSIIEKNLKIAKANLNKLSFDMFVYKDNDAVSNYISDFGSWEPEETKTLYDSLLYYSKKRNISENDIFIIDIGANIGWYSLFFGKNGYNIISFEPSKINYYILLKNFCLNQDINMIIINKGLDIIEKNSTLYHPYGNLGNAYIFNSTIKVNKSEYFAEEIRMNKLSNYIEYLKDKNLALIKLDIEGSEGKAIQSGIDLIVKYHIPFIFMEFQPSRLNSKGTEPKSFLQLFEDNGYKISIKDFLSQNYISIDKLLDKEVVNIYLVYAKFLD